MSDQDLTNTEIQVKKVQSDDQIMGIELDCSGSTRFPTCLFEQRLDSDRRGVCLPIIIKLDDRLKHILDQDHKDVQLNGVVASLPVPNEHSIRRILMDYEQHELCRLVGSPISTSPGSTIINLGSGPFSSQPLSLYSKQTLSEFINSIEIYFNTLIERNYLFHNNHEKSNFDLLRCRLGLTNSTTWVEMFGILHLLRLIVILPDFLSVCSISKPKMSQLVQCVCHFTHFLSNQVNRYLPE